MWRRASRFAAGDIILVVETDKIAYDVEAPGSRYPSGGVGRRRKRSARRHADRPLGCR